MDIQLTQIIFQIINFFVVFGALTYLVYKPILKIFDERAKRIEEGQKAAEKAIESQQNLEELRKETQTQLKKERATTLSEAQAEAKKRSQEIVAEAHERAAQEMSQAKENWEKEKRQMIKESRGAMVDAVIETAQAVVGKFVDAKAHTQLIDTQLDAIVKKL